MTHRVARVDVSTCRQVPVNHQQLLLITGLPEVVLVHVIRLRDSVSQVTWSLTAARWFFYKLNVLFISERWRRWRCVCVLPLCGQQGEQQVSWLQLSVLSWSSSAAEGSGGQQASPEGHDPIYLSEPGQEDRRTDRQTDQLNQHTLTLEWVVLILLSVVCLPLTLRLIGRSEGACPLRASCFSWETDDS